jgi:small subunit ribosomal protein S6
LNEVTTAFRFNDAVIRHLVVNMEEAVTEASPMMQKEDEKKSA